MRHNEAAAAEDDSVERGVEAGVETAAKYSTKIKAFTEPAARHVETTGKILRRFVMLPLYAVYIAALLLTTVPVVLIWYFATG